MATGWPAQGSRKRTSIVSKKRKRRKQTGKCHILANKALVLEIAGKSSSRQKGRFDSEIISIDPFD
jgi:hypothetical protein